MTTPDSPDTPESVDQHESDQHDNDERAAAVLGRQRKLRLYTIVALGIIALLVLLTTTQNWWTLELKQATIPVPGTTADGALSALALCTLALAAALAIAGPFIRLLLAILQLLIGFTVVLTAALALHAPIEPSAALVTKATGVSGETALDKLVLGVAYEPWGWLAVVFGVLAFVAGAWLLISFRFWPPASRKYSAVRMAPADGPRDAVVDWDALSSGDDPTT
jgi:hypothetical protein